MSQWISSTSSPTSIHFTVHSLTHVSDEEWDAWLLDAQAQLALYGSFCEVTQTWKNERDLHIDISAIHSVPLAFIWRQIRRASQPSPGQASIVPPLSLMKSLTIHKHSSTAWIHLALPVWCKTVKFPPHLARILVH